MSMGIMLLRPNDIIDAKFEIFLTKRRKCFLLIQRLLV